MSTPALTFHYGTMSAGKSTLLLTKEFKCREIGMTTKVYSICESVSSRIGLSKKAIKMDASLDLFEDIKNGEEVDHVFVDEGQFLTAKQVRQLANVVDSLNIDVSVYGLRNTFTNEPFEGSSYLLSIADNLIEIPNLCRCGGKAVAHKRGYEVEDVLEKNQYIAVCRKHHKEALRERV